MKKRTILAVAVAMLSGAASTRLHGADIDPRRPVGSADGGPRVENGRLEPGDRTIVSGEYVDEFPIAGKRGDRLTVDLRSREFDPYVVLVGPQGNKVQENDDYDGDPCI